MQSNSLKFVDTCLLTAAMPGKHEYERFSGYPEQPKLQMCTLTLITLANQSILPYMLLHQILTANYKIFI